MTSAESRALFRAALLVLTLSFVRAVSAHRDPAQSAPYGARKASEADSILAESHRRSSEEARRSRPLSTGETLDPNTATEEQLDRLPGVGPATARGIIRHRDEVGGLRGADDLLAVPGIGPSTLARMAPFIEWSVRPGGGARHAASRPDRPSPAPVVIDLNRASRRQLEALPGVGSTLASRILALRDTLGGFRTTDDLERVRGLGPTTVARLKPLVTVGR